jgi:thiol-disulfide isomerase/thioredoxin
MDPRPVFVLLTAKTCPACIRFKDNVWDDLKQELEKDGRVQIVTIDVPTVQSRPDPEKYHKDLYRFIGWWPTMSLYPANRWYNRNSDLIGIVKNGKLVPPTKGLDKNGKEITIPEHVDPVGDLSSPAALSKEDILKWVDYTITKDKIFTSSGVPLPPRHNNNTNNNTNNNNNNNNNAIDIPINNQPVNPPRNNFNNEMRVRTRASLDREYGNYFKHSKVK